MSTAQKQKSFKSQLAFGEEGEHEIADLLIGRGVTILPLYQFTNDSAPVFFSKNSNIISPDLICFKDDCFMVEVKTKNQWVSYNGLVETGLNRRHYEHYQKIQKATKKEFWVFFNHKKQEPVGVFFCRLNDVTRFWDGIVNNIKIHPEMAFYRKEVLKKL